MTLTYFVRLARSLPRWTRIACGLHSQSRCVLLFLGEEQRHFAACPEGVHHLGPRKESRNVHGPAEVRGQRGFDFGMVIPTPGQPTLHAMPRDFFRHLAVYTIMKQRMWPTSKLLPLMDPDAKNEAAPGSRSKLQEKHATTTSSIRKNKLCVCSKPASWVRSNTRSSRSSKATELFQWLKDNKYHYTGDEATLEHYVQAASGCSRS